MKIKKMSLQRDKDIVIQKCNFKEGFVHHSVVDMRDAMVYVAWYANQTHFSYVNIEVVLGKYISTSTNIHLPYI